MACSWKSPACLQSHSHSWLRYNDWARHTNTGGGEGRDGESERDLDGARGRERERERERASERGMGGRRGGGGGGGGGSEQAGSQTSHLHTVRVNCGGRRSGSLKSSTAERASNKDFCIELYRLTTPAFVSFSPTSFWSLSNGTFSLLWSFGRPFIQIWTACDPLQGATGRFSLSCHGNKTVKLAVEDFTGCLMKHFVILVSSGTPWIYQVRERIDTRDSRSTIRRIYASKVAGKTWRL